MWKVLIFFMSCTTYFAIEKNMYKNVSFVAKLALEFGIKYEYFSKSRKFSHLP
jgi:hypothetical protein